MSHKNLLILIGHKVGIRHSFHFIAQFGWQLLPPLIDSRIMAAEKRLCSKNRDQNGAIARHTHPRGAHSEILFFILVYGRRWTLLSKLYHRAGEQLQGVKRTRHCKRKNYLQGKSTENENRKTRCIFCKFLESRLPVARIASKH